MNWRFILGCTTYYAEPYEMHELVFGGYEVREIEKGKVIFRKKVKTTDEAISMMRHLADETLDVRLEEIAGDDKHLKFDPCPKCGSKDYQLGYFGYSPRGTPTMTAACYCGFNVKGYSLIGLKMRWNSPNAA